MRGKNYNIELIRTVSFVLVIVIHVTNYFCRAYGRISSGEYWFALILDTFARVSVPSFFMISGALLLGREEPIRKNWQRLLRFCVVLVFWSLVYYVHNVFYMGTPVDLAKVFYVPTEPHLWYLYAMIPIYLVLPFFQVMCRGMDKALVKAFLGIGTIAAIVMYVMSFFHAELYYDVPIFGDRIYAYYFFLGYFLMKYKDTIWLHTGTLLAVFLGSNAANIILTGAVTYRKGDHMERYLEYGCPLVMLSAAAFFLLMLRLGNGEVKLRERTRKLIDTWCACSFGIYLIHILFLDSFKKYVKAYEVSTWLAVPALTAGLLLLSFGCIYLVRKVPGGKKIT